MLDNKKPFKSKVSTRSRSASHHELSERLLIYLSLSASRVCEFENFRLATGPRSRRKFKRYAEECSHFVRTRLKNMKVCFIGGDVCAKIKSVSDSKANVHANL